MNEQNWVGKRTDGHMGFHGTKSSAFRFLYCYNSMIGTKIALWLIVDNRDPSTKNHSKLYKVIRRVLGTKEGLNKA
jgi:hypothetical protein